jgi:DNA-directed RNA polymerase subunit RPC12/RpoP
MARIRYSCALCGLRGLNQVQLANHLILSHHAETKESYKCGDCSATFITARGLQVHRKRTHKPDNRGTNKPYACNVCKQTSFLTRQAYQNHMYKKHDIYVCAKCSLTFNTSASFSEHKDQYHKIKQNSQNDGAQVASNVDGTSKKFYPSLKPSIKKKVRFIDEEMKTKPCTVSHSPEERNTDVSGESSHSLQPCIKQNISSSDVECASVNPNISHDLSQKRILKCKQCLKSFQSTDDLFSHIIENHAKDQGTIPSSSNTTQASHSIGDDVEKISQLLSKDVSASAEFSPQLKPLPSKK